MGDGAKVAEEEANIIQIDLSRAGLEEMHRHYLALVQAIRKELGYEPLPTQREKKRQEENRLRRYN